MNMLDRLTNRRRMIVTALAPAGVLTAVAVAAAAPPLVAADDGDQTVGEQAAAPQPVESDWVDYAERQARIANGRVDMGVEVEVEAAVEPERVELSADDVESWQSRLAELGWYAGDIDGIVGPASIDAVRFFQHASGLTVDGIVGDNTIAALEDLDASHRDVWEAANPDDPGPPEPAPTPQAAPAPSGGGDRYSRVVAIADSLPFDWRAHDVTIKIGCYLYQGRCPWGVYEPETRAVWIGDGTFASNARLHYVVAHEIAHAWQFATGRTPTNDTDLADWGHTGHDGFERAADCLAAAWGATTSHYWNCPSSARNHMLDLFRANSG